MLRTGNIAPLFEHINQHEKNLKSKDLIGKKNLIVFFFESVKAPVCKKELLAFNKYASEFERLDTEVIGVSVDNFILQNIADKNLKIKYSLVSDIGNQLRKLFQVEPRLGYLPGRVTYVIDKKGVIRNAISTVFECKDHVEGSLKSIRDLETEMGRY